MSRHGDGRMHRAWYGVKPTLDPWTFEIPALRPVEEAGGECWSSPYPVVAMFWPQRFYQVFLLLKPQTTEYYCNVITPCVYHRYPQQIHFFDLQLDVYVTPDGPELRDLDEFTEAKEEYPGAWVSGAEAAVTELMTLTRMNRGPFSAQVADRWRSQLT